MGDPEEFLEAEPEITVIYETRRDSDSGEAGASSGGMSFASTGPDYAPPADGGGGMSASAGGAPYSTAGSVPTASDASEPAPPPDMSDVIGVVQPPSMETIVETALSIADAVSAVAGELVGPTMLVQPRMLSPDERSSDDGT
jgi:hypothetical protein